MTLLRRIGRARIPILLLSAVLILVGCEIVGPLLGMSPEAVAGDDQTVAVGTEATLDGGSSVGQQLRFAWSITSKPAGSTTTISGSSSEIARMTPDLAGTYTVTLKVSNTYGDDTDTVLITATGGGGGTIVLPGKPANITASNQTTSGSIISWTVGWSAATNATKYYVYTDSSPNGGFAALVGETAGTSLAHSGLTAGFTYYYKIKAQNGYGGTFSDASAPFTAQNAAPVTNPPTGLRLNGQAQAQSVSLIWDAAANATGYRLFRKDPITGLFSILRFDGSSTSFIDNIGIVASTSYSYIVRAFYPSINGWSSESPSFTTTTAAPTAAPAAPTGVFVGDPTSSSLTVFWTGSAGATGYRIFRFIDGTYTLIATLPQATTSFTDTDAALLPETTYYYQVEAFNAIGPSATRGTASGATSAIGVVAPEQPTIESVAAVSEDALVIAWTGGANAEVFHLQRMTAANQWETLADDIPAAQSSFTNFGLDAASTYTYQVIAVKTVSGKLIKSAPSNSASGTTLSSILPPGQPYGPTPTEGASDLDAELVAFSWTAPENPDGDFDYTFRLYLGVDGSAPVLVAPGLTSPAWSPPEGVIQAGKSFAWYVNVQDSQNHSSTSETWSFETAAVTYSPPSVDVWISSSGIYRVGLSTISFEGSWSQGDGLITSKSWQIKARPEGSACNLSIAFDNAMETTTASFVPDLVGAYTVALTVTDANELAASIWIYDIEVVAADASGAYFFIH